jgi:hypothetical protein
VNRARGSLVLVVLMAAAPAAAQDPRPPVHPYEIHSGQRIRLSTTPAAGALERHGATVTASDHEGLAIVRQGRGEVIPFAQITQLEVRRGWRHLRRAAVAGALVGAAIGVAVVESRRGEPADDWKRGRSALYGALGGAAVGTLTAAALYPPKWYPVSLDAVRPAPPTPAGPQARVSFRF